jgi:hypothetical protein
MEQEEELSPGDRIVTEREGTDEIVTLAAWALELERESTNCICDDSAVSDDSLSISD